MHKIVGPLTALCLVALSSAASANESGLAGYTGKPNASSPSGQSCNGCHTGGAAPTVSLTGPATMAAGSKAEFTLNVTGAGKTAGAAAATDGVVMTPGTGMRDSFGEMVQSGAQGGTGVFKFTVTAPANGNAIKIWATGLGGASQGSSTSRQLVKDVAITGGGTGSTTSSSSGASTSSSGASGTSTTSSTGGTSGDNPATSSGTSGAATSSGTSGSKTTKPGSSSGDDDDDDDSTDRRSSFNDSSSSCSATPGSNIGAGISSLALAMFGLTLIVRRRKHRNGRSTS